MFDKLLLISEGYPIYYGKAKDTMQYFSSLSFTPEIPMNPAEFMLDLATGQVNNISFPQDTFKDQESADRSKSVIKVRLCIIYLLCRFNLIIPLNNRSVILSIYNSSIRKHWKQKKKMRIMEQQTHQNIFS